MTRTYRGWRDNEGAAHVVVRNNNKRAGKLPMRLDLDNHSPTGFEWGYGGSGPAQLALALLADALDDDNRALRLHQNFKWGLICRLDRDQPWSMTQDEVVAWADKLDQKRIA